MAKKETAPKMAEKKADKKSAAKPPVKVAGSGGKKMSKGAC